MQTGREEAAVATVSTAGTNTAAYANTSQPHQHSAMFLWKTCGMEEVSWNLCVLTLATGEEETVVMR